MRLKFSLVLLFFLGKITCAQTISVTQITLYDSSRINAISLELPYFVQQAQWGLLPLSWTITLPASLASRSLPALLIPQPVQGAVYSIDGEIIYELSASDHQTLRNWYQPVLISIPKALIHQGQDTYIQVNQTGHLRGWFIAPMLLGDLQELRSYFSNYLFISQTLYTTTNFLSSIVGCFFLIIGLRSKSKAYFYSGMTTITWSLLISVALTSELPTYFYYYWRMALYAATGMLIFFVSMFINAVFQNEIPKKIKLFGLAYLNIGWIVYALYGIESEQWLDIYWTGLAVCIYVVSVALVIIQALQKRYLARVLPIAMHWLITSLLAFHDYILQSGVLHFNNLNEPLPLWANLMLQPIYLTHIALPVFVVMAMWLLIQDHNQKNNNELRHLKLMEEQRARIVNDIHDGVGSRINLMLWSLRTESPPKEQLESDLQRCMEELRFAINPSHASHETLHKSLTDLSQRLKIQARRQGIKLKYERKGQPMPVASEIGLHLYKATQESLSNALRHSQATCIEVNLSQSRGHISIEVKDDGTGIPGWDESLQQQNFKSTSIGLTSLFQRIKSKGGDVRITSSSEGTTVLMTI